MIREELDRLSTNDIYSLVLFAILQLKKSPQYAVLSELIYCLDKDSLLNLCKQFGGMTVAIPTLDELNDVVDALLLYCYVNLEHQSLKTGLDLLGRDSEASERIKNIYIQILHVIDDYDFRRV